jgi:hypothetical protein
MESTMDPRDPDSVIAFLQQKDPDQDQDEDVALILRLYSAEQLDRLRLALTETTAAVGGIQFDLEGFSEEAELGPLLQVLKGWEQLSAVLLNNFTALPAVAGRFLRVLGANPSLQVLVLNDGIMPATDLIAFLTTSKSIEEVSIDAIEFQSPDPVVAAGRLADAVGACDSLRVLNIDLFDAVHFGPLIHRLQSKSHQLQELTIAAVPGQTVTASEVDQIAALLRDHVATELKLELKGFYFGGDSFRSVAQALVDGTAVQIDICECSFDVESTALFETMLVAPPSKFDRLRMSCMEMHFTNPIEAVLASLLRPSSSLKRLEVDAVSGGIDEGTAMAAIMKALETNTQLEYLYLDTIRNVATYRALLGGLPKVAGLKCLECDGFEFDKFDKGELKHSLKQCGSILEFKCNGFED